jgi:hypothetical protein
MAKRHWRELVEIVGVVGIVAALILLAAQVRKSNDIAASNSALQLADSFNALDFERASNSEFAKLFPKLESPEVHLTTATDASQIQGIARHYFNIMGSVQSAYEQGLIDASARNAYIESFADQFTRWPGIRAHYVTLFEQRESIQTLDVYAPIADYIAAQVAPEEP